MTVRTSALLNTLHAYLRCPVASRSGRKHDLGLRLRRLRRQCNSNWDIARRVASRGSGGFDSERVLPQTKKGYDDPLQAVRCAYRRLLKNQASGMKKIEYGGLIYNLGGQYFSSNDVAGTAGSVPVRSATVPSGATLWGYYHTQTLPGSYGWELSGYDVLAAYPNGKYPGPNGQKIRHVFGTNYDNLSNGWANHFIPNFLDGGTGGKYMPPLNIFEGECND